MTSLTFNKNADAAYLYIVKSGDDSTVEKTVRVNDNILMDFDRDGKLLGVEILSARKMLKKEVLLEASAIA